MTHSNRNIAKYFGIIFSILENKKQLISFLKKLEKFFENLRKSKYFFYPFFRKNEKIIF